jgi:flagellar FliL protein
MANATTAPAAPATADEAPKSGSKKKLLLIGITALALAGGGAAWFLRGGDDTEKAEKKAEHKAPAQYIAMDPPFVVNFDAGAGARFLQVTVQLMTRDLATVEFLKAHDPVIRNDLLLLLGNQKVEDVASREGKEQLRVASLYAVRQIVKSEGGDPDKLEAVYFTSFVMQ